MTKIVPALLTDKKSELEKMLEICKNFTDYVQIDIMDGEFVPSKSISLQDLQSVNLPVEAELHLMVKDPFLWIKEWKKVKRIIYHSEIELSHKEIIETVKDNGFEVGVAINPSTSWTKLEKFLKDIDLVLFMSVNPGFYGSKFIPSVLEKIKKFRLFFPDKEIGIDGGIKEENIKQVIALGVDYIYIGSAILKESSPKQAFQKFIKYVWEV
ncbi:MAG: ribulose-phosphate 3-epimerase [Candidatus Omnitrophota bacterium]|nr:MAG: ribulose-phosphate 3-epimerase [Candidatus Omnitrophota bacterium]